MFNKLCSSIAIGLKVMCFVALRLEDEPLSEMSVELEGTAHVCTALPAWCEICLGVSQLLGAFLMTIITNYRVICVKRHHAQYFSCMQTSKWCFTRRNFFLADPE